MTVVPLPDVPCVRVRVIGVDDANNDWGTRFYLSYSGAAPTGANCTTLAGDIESAFSTNLRSLMGNTVTLTEVDVLDIATNSGLSGQWTGSLVGSRTGTLVAAQTAMNIEYGIARRYRGGKPRGYWPFGVQGDLADAGHWDNTILSATSTGIAAFFSAIEGLSVGSMGTLKHVNLSYYNGFTNHTNTSGRARAVPNYKATATHDDITGYFPKNTIGSQRRRRNATTP